MNIDNERIKEMYNSGASYRDIGLIVGFSRTTIGKRLKKMGVKARNRNGAYNKIQDKKSRERAHNAINRALKKGVIVRPESCSKCGKIPKRYADGRSGIHAHHDSYEYNKALDVRFLCTKCHYEYHKEQQQQINKFCSGAAVPVVPCNRSGVFNDGGMKMSESKEDMFPCPNAISISQLANGIIPKPKHTLNWGENMPKDILEALRNGDTAILNNEDGEPHSMVFKDLYGTTREGPVPEGYNPK